ncbi:branched-chain amino acid ABC transporter permease [Rhodoligotrophos defluvii]|uniref:branched-chain amino acid ABC transporter permease n=1 Tax=Rhodoligotrophos defluvii TaxID=2561934 RepID=UPI001EEF9DBD|nr:branched-chain amino acid ABC transporter permease [Rhodoligotrophos defluvii]
MSIKLLVFQVLNGLGIGMIYFLLAVGLTMIFGLMRFVNFTHGALYMVAAYVAYAISQATGSMLWALLLGPAAAALLAIIAERLLLRHTYQLPHEAQILITFAVALLLQESIVMIFGSLGQNVPVPEILSGIVMIGNFVYPAYRLAVVAVAAAIAIAMWLVIERTRFGAILRAGSESAEMVGLLGIDVKKVFLIAFALGGALAGLAGALAAPLRGVDPFMAREALSIAFVVVVLGGIGSFTGALVGGLLIGIIQSVMASLWPQGAQLMIYAAMALVLLLRPTGLMGRA